MASTAESNENSAENLSSIFNQALDLFNKVSNTQEPTNSLQVQLDIKNAMRQCEQATRLVSYTGLFSKNEGVEEVATNDLQYFLLPALLGMLTMKLTTGERKEIIEVAEIYFKDFITRCNDYKLSNFELNKENKSNEVQIRTQFDQIAASINTRATKIQRCKEMKELKQKMAELKQNVENEHCDEDIKREYFITMIKSFINESIEELNSIEMEKPILEHMAQMKKDEKPEPKRPPPAPLRPVIITKDELQKAVYGAGYPSLPTMTVQEFYDNRVRDGVFPDPSKPPSGGPANLQQAALAGVELFDDDKEDEDKEKMVDEDDPEYLQRRRNMDEYKDEHRRGWGNRMNRS